MKYNPDVQKEVHKLLMIGRQNGDQKLSNMTDEEIRQASIEIAELETFNRLQRMNKPQQ